MNADTGHHRRCVLQAKCGQMQADIRGKETRECHELSILNPKLKLSITLKKKLKKKRVKKIRNPLESKKGKKYPVL